jgi:hypothetical protein
MSHRNISGRADKDSIQKWSDRASANSFHNSPANKAQVKANKWFQPRLRADETGPASYPGSREDRGGK